MCLKPVECMRSYEDLFNYFAGTWGPNNYRQREKVGAISCCGLWYPIWAKLVQNSCLRLHWKLINHTLPFNVPWCYYPVNQPTSTSNSLKIKIGKSDPILIKGTRDFILLTKLKIIPFLDHKRNYIVWYSLHIYINISILTFRLELTSIL